MIIPSDRWTDDEEPAARVNRLSYNIIDNNQFDIIGWADINQN